ncbi:hypothetical protein L914_14233, partial [Phytophthora nicotianae]
ICQLEVKLFCAIVGVAGSVFSVRVDMSDSVDDVKDAIKVKKPDTIKCEADKLQVYLAKKDGARLTEAGAESVVLDEHGHPRGFEKMMPSLWLKNAKYFGESFQPGEGQVHVLVVVPEGAVVSANEGSPDTMIKEIHAVTVGKKRKRYVLSRVGSTQGRQLLNDLDVQVELVRTVPFAAGEGSSVDPYKWESVIIECGKEIVLTEEQQRERYREYVERNIGAVLEEK